MSVDGRPARFVVDAKHSKLAITPPRGIRNGRRFRTVVRYGGIQRPLRERPASRRDGSPIRRQGRSSSTSPSVRWAGTQQQRSRRQGDLHDPYHRSSRLERPRHRRPGRPTDGAREERQEHLRLEGGRPDLDLPRIGLGGQVRRQLARPGQAGEDRARRGEPNKPVPFYTAITAVAARKGKAQSVADLGRSSEIVEFYSGYYGRSATRSRRWAGS